MHGIVAQRCPLYFEPSSILLRCFVMEILRKIYPKILQFSSNLIKYDVISLWWRNWHGISQQQFKQLTFTDVRAHTYRLHAHFQMNLLAKNTKSTTHFGYNNEMTSHMTYGISIVDRFQRFPLSTCLSYSYMPKYTLLVAHLGYVMEKTYIFWGKMQFFVKKSGIWKNSKRRLP